MPRTVYRGLFRPLVAAGLGASLAMPASAAHGGTGVVLGSARGDELHVMSYNLRYASDSGPHSWPRRRSVMAELLRREQPTVLGTQEGLYPQLTDLEHDLPGYYDWIGEGRAGGHRDEFAAIFFDTRRLDPLAYGHFWLSGTPDVPGSRSWGNKAIRMATWVRFADKRTGGELAVLNTHLDNASENARLRGAELVRDRINAFPPGLPVVLTGDFNTPAERSPQYDILARGAGLTDTWTAAAQRRTPLTGTFHGYGALVPGGPRIDWILTRGATTVRAAGINAFARDGRYASDHLPAQAVVTLAR